jgi:hypothetical protein
MISIGNKRFRKLRIALRPNIYWSVTLDNSSFELLEPGMDDECHVLGRKKKFSSSTVYFNSFKMPDLISSKSLLTQISFFKTIKLYYTHDVLKRGILTWLFLTD